MEQCNAALALTQTNQAKNLAQFQELLAIPSISTLSEHQPDMQRAAEWIAAELRGLGMNGVEIIPTDGHAVVYAESLKKPGAPTALVYGHYDVQPVDPLDEWESDPFAGEVRGDYIYARGASDMKGQFFALLKAVQALTETGGLPINLKFMLEGEEEIGSPHLAQFIAEHKEKLACDFVLNCDAGVHSPDAPGITYSLRGLAYFELHLQAAKKDLHSGRFGGSVLNPIHVLAELIASFHDADGCVTLPGFYDKVRPLDDDERANIALAAFDDNTWLEMAGAKALHGEQGYTTAERIGARPTLDVNGIWGGFTGEGAKTVLPAKAHAKISTRLVADQDPEEVEKQLRNHIAAHLPEGIDWELHEHSWGPGSTMDRYSPYMKAAATAIEKVFGKPPVFTREGGSVPVVGMMQTMLGVDSVMLGFALPDDGIHGPNERQYLPNFFNGIETYVHYLCALGEQ